jgi:hypothetical protein
MDILNLPIDLLDIIIDNITLELESCITILEKKIKLMYSKLSPLSITYMDNSYRPDNYVKYNISYGKIHYCMDDYLFDNFKGNIKLVSIYEDILSDLPGETFVSKTLVNPTYLDILIEANKSLVITGTNTCSYLEGIYPIDKNYLKRQNIKISKNIIYYELMIGC